MSRYSKVIAQTDTQTDRDTHTDTHTHTHTHKQDENIIFPHTRAIKITHLKLRLHYWIPRVYLTSDVCPVDQACERVSWNSSMSILEHWPKNFNHTFCIT